MAPRRTPKNPEGRMALVEHLKEFRNRLGIAALAILIGSIVGWIYYDAIISYLATPLIEAAKRRFADNPDARVRLVNTDVTGPFTIKMHVAMFAGIIIASPVWIWQIWAFVLPGLTGKEKRYASGFMLAAAPLFILGCWTATLVIPSAVEMFLSFTTSQADNLLPLSEYIDWITRLIISFGLAYLLPLALVALNLMGLVKGSFLLKGWRFALILILLFGALMSPTPDPWSMFALAIPLFGLYMAAVGIALFVDRRRKKDEPDWVDTPDDVASPL